LEYIPAPIDTSDIELDSDLVELLEVLSRNTHDVWARQRLSEGWTYGLQRDDDCKQHPCLVPYDELSEIEKGYDRIIARQVIQVILALGYRIEKAGSGSNSPPPIVAALETTALH
jgi:hypothetical protein